jgi:hypothetical protein
MHRHRDLGQDTVARGLRVICQRYKEKTTMEPKSIFLAAITMALTFSPVFAADPIPEFNSMLTSAPQDEYLNSEKRTIFVNSVGEYCSITLANLPTNTPQETKWVNDEMQTSDSDKLRRLLTSKEYARYKIGEAYTDCITTTKQLQKAQSDLNLVLEAQLYLVLLEEFSGGDIEYYAQKADVDSGKYGMGLFRLVRTNINRITATTIGDIR